MKVEITVPEVIEIFNEIQQKPESLFEMIRLGLQQTVGEYLTAIMNAELPLFSKKCLMNIVPMGSITEMVRTIENMH